MDVRNVTVQVHVAHTLDNEAVITNLHAGSIISRHTRFGQQCTLRVPCSYGRSYKQSCGGLSTRITAGSSRRGGGCVAGLGDC